MMYVCVLFLNTDEPDNQHHHKIPVQTPLQTGACSPWVPRCRQKYEFDTAWLATTASWVIANFEVDTRANHTPRAQQKAFETAA